jgi:hypothetical protein
MEISRFRLALKYTNHSIYFQWAVFALVVGLMFSFPCCAIGGFPLTSFSLAALPADFLALMPFVPGAALVVYGIRDVRRKVQLVAEGRPALGIINDVTIERHKATKYVGLLTYSYWRDEGGQEPVRCEAEVWRPPYVPGEIEPGEIVLVLYDPADPGRSEIDRFDVRSADRIRLTMKRRKCPKDGPPE